MKKLLRRIALGATSLGLSFGWAGVAAADTNTIGTTGQGSTNVISCNVDETYTLTNMNSVNATHFNTNVATSGNVSIDDSTGAGAGGSGAVSQSAMNSTSVAVNNGGSSAAAFGGAGAGVAAMNNNSSINTTGQDSTNRITYNVNRNVQVTNTNMVNAISTNVQTAQSGNVTVDDSTSAGNAHSGNVSQTSSSSTSVNVSN